MTAQEQAAFARSIDIQGQINTLSDRIAANTPVPGYYNRAENKRRERLLAELAPQLEALRCERRACYHA